jgi:hypothetical protein
MQVETKRVFERVIAKAAILRKSTFLADLDQGSWKISFRHREVCVTRPPDEARDAFILNFRFFIVGNEATSFKSMAKLADDPELSVQWKERFGTLRAAVNDHLATMYGEYRYGGSIHRFSNRQIMDTFLNGGLVHANDPDAVARFEEWMRYPGIAAILEMWFITTVKSLCMAIFLLSDACEEELQRVGLGTPADAQATG